MGEVQPLPQSRREFIADGPRSQLRATWHMDSGMTVISLWRGEECVATSHLSPAEAGRLSTFLTGGLADLASDGRIRVSRRHYRVGQAWRTGMGSALRRARSAVARGLGALSRRIAS